MARRKGKAGNGADLKVTAVVAVVVGAFALFPIACGIVGAVITLIALAINLSKSKKLGSRTASPASQPMPTMPVTPARSVPPALVAPAPAPAAVVEATAEAAAEQIVAPQEPTTVPCTDSDEPVSAKSAAAATVSYTLPPPPKTFGAARWVPAGHPVKVGNVVIPGGMVYVGTKLSTPAGFPDPSLIDPSKSVAKHGDYKLGHMAYWPSYSDITPSARRAYLNWLAGGRCDPDADIGYVFLFFYGIERRILADTAEDPAARADFPTLAAELQRLLSIYGEKSSSFQGYAGTLLDLMRFADPAPKLYEQPVPRLNKDYQLPLHLRLALGQAAVDGARVPTHLAFAWAQAEPSFSLRTPAIRCSEQFRRMFELKYAEMCGAGMVLPRNRTKLKLTYSPASSGFRGSGITLSFDDIPDVTVLTAPAKRLHEVVEAATKPLDSYSRLLAKDPGAAESLEGTLLLPQALWPGSKLNGLQMLRGRLTDGLLALPLKELLSALGAKTALAKDKLLTLASGLEGSGLGFEPDILRGAKLPKPEDKVVLFEQDLHQAEHRPDGQYFVAALTLELASAVAAADGDFSAGEVAHLQRAVQSWKHLSSNRTRRLLAHLELLRFAPASIASIKKKLEPLELPARETLASFVATMAQADGEVSPDEVKMLERIYKALGVDTKKVFTDVHSAAAGKTPSPAIVPKTQSGGFKLDTARIAELQKDTEKVFALLANIFTEAEEVVAAATPEPDPVEAAEDAHGALLGLQGLDEAHTALARKLLTQPSWSREELLNMATDLDLMLDGALEHINEATFDAHDMALVEGDDPVTVNAEFLEHVQA